VHLVAADDERRAPYPLARQLPGEEHELDRRPVHADPLRLDIVGDAVAVEAGAELDPGGDASGELERPAECRTVLVLAQPIVVAAAHRAARGVEPHRIHVAEIDVLRAGVRNRDGVAEGGQIVGGDGGRRLIGVHRGDLEPEGRETQGVAADAAPEIRDAAATCVAEPAGMAGGHAQARGLLETRRGEEHPGGERPELHCGARTESRLADDGGDEVGPVARGAEPADGRRDGCRRFDRARLIQQAQALGGEKGAQLAHLHRSSLGARPCWHSRCTSARTPLDLPLALSV